MIKIIQSYLHSAFDEKKSYLFNCLWDFFSIIVSTSFLYLIWAGALKLLSVFGLKAIEQKMLIYNTYFMLILIAWGIISFTYLIIYYVKLVFSINKAMKEKLDEETAGL